MMLLSLVVALAAPDPTGGGLLPHANLGATADDARAVIGRLAKAQTIARRGGELPFRLTCRDMGAPCGGGAAAVLARLPVQRAALLDPVADERHAGLTAGRGLPGGGGILRAARRNPEAAMPWNGWRLTIPTDEFGRSTVWRVTVTPLDGPPAQISLEHVVPPPF